MAEKAVSPELTDKEDCSLREDVLRAVLAATQRCATELLVDQAGGLCHKPRSSRAQRGSV